MFRRSNPQGTFGSLDVLRSPRKRAFPEAKHGSGAFRRKALPVLRSNESALGCGRCVAGRTPRGGGLEVLKMEVVQVEPDGFTAQSLTALGRRERQGAPAGEADADEGEPDG